MFNPDELVPGEIVVPMLVGTGGAVKLRTTASQVWTFQGLDTVPVHNTTDVVRLAHFGVRTPGDVISYSMREASFESFEPWYFLRNYVSLGMKRCMFIPEGDAGLMFRPDELVLGEAVYLVFDNRAPDLHRPPWRFYRLSPGDAGKPIVASFGAMFDSEDAPGPHAMTYLSMQYSRRERRWILMGDRIMANTVTFIPADLFDFRWTVNYNPRELDDSDVDILD